MIFAPLKAPPLSQSIQWNDSLEALMLTAPCRHEIPSYNEQLDGATATHGDRGAFGLLDRIGGDVGVVVTGAVGAD
jgi:hypothetical protein